MSSVKVNGHRHVVGYKEADAAGRGKRVEKTFSTCNSNFLSAGWNIHIIYC